MVYSSVVFLFYFLPLALGGYYLMPGIRSRNVFMGVVGLLFYFWGGGFLVAMLPLAALTAWFFSWLIVRTRFKELFLWLAIITFIGVLLRFKYLEFLFENLTASGITFLPQLSTLNVLGVSFFTFQAISYVADVYKNNNRFEKNPLYVMLYIGLFPNLLSGPLVRYHTIKQQFIERPALLSGFAAGAKRFIEGLGKKVLIADTLSPLVAQIVDNGDITIGPSVAWAGMAVFAIQIFFDFSGYTDMAIGVGKMFGFELPENFNYPYISRSITEFWRRWHISFTLWIKEYIFNPVAIGLRYWSTAGIVTALMLTFFVCGLWHGPSWNFVLWGTSQGILLVLEELFLLKYLKKIRWFGLLYTLFVIVTCLVFFRASDFAHALDYFSHMFTPSAPNALGLHNFFAAKHLVAFGVGVMLSVPLKIPVAWKRGFMSHVFDVTGLLFLFAVLLLSVMTLLSRTYMPFIYFQF